MLLQAETLKEIIFQLYFRSFNFFIQQEIYNVKKSNKIEMHSKKQCQNQENKHSRPDRVF